MGKIKQELVTFGKAELTASIASIVDFGLAFFLSDIIGIYYGLANALGVMSGGVTNCSPQLPLRIRRFQAQEEEAWHGDISSYGP